MDKRKYMLIFAAVILVVLIAISTNFKPSTSVSRYRSVVNSTNEARVAKWDITGVTKRKGESILLNAGFKDNVFDGTGNWFFDIDNLSEVNASISESSTIALRLEGESLDTTKDIINWDFLGVTNPVNFKIYAYRESAENILFYKNKNDNTEITFIEYNQKTDLEKQDYIEIIKEPADAKSKVVLDTSDKDKVITFNKKNELVGSKMVSYYEVILELKDLIDTFSFELGFGDTKQAICFRIEWSVDSTGESGTGMDTEQSYNAYTFRSGTSSSNKYGEYEIDGQKYYIEQEAKSFFKYLTYTSSLGGEPRFEFSSNSGLEGSKIIVPYSRLTEEQKGVINSYSELTTKKPTNVDEIKHLAEYLEYVEYQKFVTANKDFASQLPYLSMGLKFSINFNLKVEQID